MLSLVESVATSNAFESQLQYKQWHPGVSLILAAEVIKLCSRRQLLLFQSISKYQGFYPLAILANKLQYMTWDPGVQSSVCARSVEGTTTGVADADLLQFSSILE